MGYWPHRCRRRAEAAAAARRGGMGREEEDRHAKRSTADVAYQGQHVGRSSSIALFLFCVLEKLIFLLQVRQQWCMFSFFVTRISHLIQNGMKKSEAVAHYENRRGSMSMSKFHLTLQKEKNPPGTRARQTASSSVSNPGPQPAPAPTGELVELVPIQLSLPPPFVAGASGHDGHVGSTGSAAADLPSTS